MNSFHRAQAGQAHSEVVSDNHVEAFLMANNPCYCNFSTEMRDAVREYLQRQMDGGDLTHEHLAEYERRAATTAFLVD